MKEAAQRHPKVSQEAKPNCQKLGQLKTRRMRGKVGNIARQVAQRCQSKDSTEKKQVSHDQLGLTRAYCQSEISCGRRAAMGRFNNIFLSLPVPER